MPRPPNAPVWWSTPTGATSVNRLNVACGGEWMDGPIGSQFPNTPAPMILPYVKNPLIFVCPKRKRGLTLLLPLDNGIRVSRGSFPTGSMISVALTHAQQPAAAMMGMIPTIPFKGALAKRPAQLVCATDASGSNDPANSDHGDASANAAWLDGEWKAILVRVLALHLLGRLIAAFRLRRGKPRRHRECSLCRRPLRISLVTNSLMGFSWALIH